ncbi:MAG: DDE-type integrase/transposase/recombinase [Eubacterium sp.]|nr:DDE-type integrase/transposase/recombinase [Eubacterium sp.]
MEEAEKRKELGILMEKFREIVKKLGFVPGKRTFRTYLFRDYGLNVSVKRCAGIMRRMNLVADRPKKDAYKGQATHGHRCAAPENKVKQEFYIGPRKVILTDISYLYYGKNRSVLYLCAFRDAYTREILGSAAGTRMDTGLVRRAYEGMKEKHGKELKRDTSVYVHSDQGSQYLSTTFKELLSDDGFVQSVSRRGNSLDTSPMLYASFFIRTFCRDALVMGSLRQICADKKVSINRTFF